MLRQIISVIILFGIFAAMGVSAQTFGVYRVAAAEQETIDTQGRKGETLEQAVSRIQQEMGGEILSAEVLKKSGSVVYRIKLLLPAGRVRIVNVFPKEDRQ